MALLFLLSSLMTWMALGNLLQYLEILICLAIVDDTFRWAPDFDTAMLYLHFQLGVCRAQNLSLSLKKSLFFPDCDKFVGHDICTDDNCPAHSKKKLLKTWPVFKVVCDLHSFLGFINFFSLYIPNFELPVTWIRVLMKLDIESSLDGLWTPSHEAERHGMINAYLSDPCLARFDPDKCLYVLADWSALGFGVVLLKPTDGEASFPAMHREMDRGPCKFLKKDTKLQLHPVCF